MGLINRTIRIAENTSIEGVDHETEGRDFTVVDKINATHYGNAGDDEYLASSVKTGRIAMILPCYLKGATILPGDEQR